MGRWPTGAGVDDSGIVADGLAMMQAPATRDAPSVDVLYEVVRNNLDPGAGDVPVDG